eukprot:5311267-Karenia_brevis.AAC.1
MRQWLGQQLPLTKAAEGELLRTDRKSPTYRVPLGRRVADYVEPECIYDIHRIDTWRQYVESAFGPSCRDPKYLSNQRHITVMDYVRAVWPV